MDFQKAKNIIKNSFCQLLNFKERGDILEVITGFSTLNDKVISIFIKHQAENEFVITDAGWVDMNYYDNPLYEESEELVDKIVIEYQSSFDISVKKEIQTGIRYYYKKCSSIDEIPSCIYDLSNFLAGIINVNFVQFKDKLEENERDKFRQNVTAFLKANKPTNSEIYFNQGLEDQKNVRFSSIINKGSTLYLINYITGSSNQYFENSLRRAIVNFEASLRSQYSSTIKQRLSVFNNESSGYNLDSNYTYLSLLKEKTNTEPILWTEKEKILEYI